MSMTVSRPPVPVASPDAQPWADDEPIQLLAPDGRRREHPGLDHPHLSGDELRALYRDLVLVRRLDTEATALQRQGELGLWASLLGQEAAQVGAGRAMAAADVGFPTYREHGVAWCRGVDPLALLGLFRGTTTGGWDPSETGFHLYAIVIGSQTLHATGYAMGITLDAARAVRNGSPAPEPAAAVAFLGDGATSQGDVSEAFVWAASMAAPVVFFCQNNQWAISEPVSRQSRIPLARRASGFGFPGYRVDGNDVLAVLAVTRRALADAREGRGPSLIEAVTYRMGAHTTSDDPTRYREAAELELWRRRDPVERMRLLLEREDLVDPAWLSALDEESEALAVHLREGCRALPDPDPEQMFNQVYAEQTAELRDQQEAYAAYLATLEPAG